MCARTHSSQFPSPVATKKMYERTTRHLIMSTVHIHLYISNEILFVTLQKMVCGNASENRKTPNVCIMSSLMMHDVRATRRDHFQSNDNYHTSNHKKQLHVHNLIIILVTHFRQLRSWWFTITIYIVLMCKFWCGVCVCIKWNA